MFIFVFFFFSSRRRHTRFSRDWSSDVCSSDLGRGPQEPSCRDARAALSGGQRRQQNPPDGLQTRATTPAEGLSVDPTTRRRRCSEREDRAGALATARSSPVRRPRPFRDLVHPRALHHLRLLVWPSQHPDPSAPLSALTSRYRTLSPSVIVIPSVPGPRELTRSPAARCPVSTPAEAARRHPAPQAADVGQGMRSRCSWSFSLAW